MKKKKKEKSQAELADAIARLEDRLASIEKKLGMIMPPSDKPLKSKVEAPFRVLQSGGTPHISSEFESPIEILSTLSTSRKKTLEKTALLEERGLLPTAERISELTNRRRNQESANLKRLWQLGLLERSRKGHEIIYKVTNRGRRSLASNQDT